MDKRMCAVTVGLLCWGHAPSALAGAGELPCPSGWLSVRAMVTRVSPPRAELVRRTAGSQASVPIAVGGVLCEGDALLFASAAEDVQVELYEAGKLVTWAGHRGPYTVPSGLKASLGAAAAYLSAVFEGASELGPPPMRPNPTAARGDGSTAAASPIQAVKHLRDLPRQRLAHGARPTVAWLGGVGPYTCQALGEDGDALWSHRDIAAGWCTYPPDLTRSTRLVVRDAQGRSAGWNIAAAMRDELPRPAWVARDAATPAAPELAAWAIWIWQNAGPEWRLQAVAMLGTAAQSEWLASYFLDSVLAEVPVVAPR